MDILEENYKIELDSKIGELINTADNLNSLLISKKPYDEDLWQVIKQKLVVEWTYNSNAIEGSTLTEGETLFFLQNGLTVEGKPFKDFVDAKNHAEAIEFLYDVIKNRQEITPSLIKGLNSLLLEGLKYIPACDIYGNKIQKKITQGEYKKLPNHVLQSDGKIHRYVEPIYVNDEIEFLCSWINKNIEINHPIVVAAFAHYNMVRIHPFDDGNGRGARLLMNLVLLKKNFPPAIIKIEDSRKYYEVLSEADKGDYNKFVEFIAKSSIDTLNSILEYIK